MEMITDKKMINTDFEVTSLDDASPAKPESIRFLLRFFVAGILFGVLLVKSEVISWFRIQEMFHLQSFHMFGVIGSAVVVGMFSVMLIKKFKIKTVSGDAIIIHKKVFSKGTIYGGLIFGFGWAITGACPGPLFAQFGSGLSVTIITLIAAIIGTWVYGKIRESLPH